jgi:RNA polymerase sigma factor (sigma-70 family)
MTHHPPTYAGANAEVSDIEPSDAELITAVRGGDDGAYATLWRRHEVAARRLARQLGNPSNADDLVSEAFLRVYRALKSGSGPDGAFRPYLFSTLRRFNIDNGRSYYARVSLTDDDRDLEGDAGDSAADVLFENAEGSAAWRAWNSLPDATRTLLWHLVIEEETPAQIAPLIGTTPNGVSSRAVRAKERLRQAFLQQHLLDAPSDGCRRARSRLGEYVRNALSARDQTEVRAHLDTCDGCRAALFDVTDLNQTMRVFIAPVVLGGAAVAGHYIASAAAAKGALFGSVHLRHLRNPAVAGATIVAIIALGLGSAFALRSLDTTTHHQPAAAGLHSAPSAASSAQPSVVAPQPVLTPTTPTATVTPSAPAPSRASSPVAKSTPPAASIATKVSVVASKTPAPPVAPPPPAGPETTMVTFYIDTTAPAGTGTTTLSTTGGWKITDVVLVVNGVAAPGNCSWTGLLPACTLANPPVGEQQYEVTAVSPTNLNPPGELDDIYSADGVQLQSGTNQLGTN